VRTTEVASELVANVLQVLVQVGQPVAEGVEWVVLHRKILGTPVPVPTRGSAEPARTAVGDVVQDGDVMVVVQG
jgi:biotin carboxyl carrier protein